MFPLNCTTSAACPAPSNKKTHPLRVFTHSDIKSEADRFSKKKFEIKRTSYIVLLLIIKGETLLQFFLFINRSKSNLLPLSAVTTQLLTFLFEATATWGGTFEPNCATPEQQRESEIRAAPAAPLCLLEPLQGPSTPPADVNEFCTVKSQVQNHCWAELSCA